MVGNLDALYYAPTPGTGFVPAANLTPQHAQKFMPLIFYTMLALVQEFLPHMLAEASFAQWGSLAYTWARRRQQPSVLTCGKRKALKVLGLIDYFTGRFFWQHQTIRFTAGSYQAFLQTVLNQTAQPIILLQDGAKYHTAAAIQPFFAVHRDRLTVYQFPGYSPD